MAVQFVDIVPERRSLSKVSVYRQLCVLSIIGILVQSILAARSISAFETIKRLRPVHPISVITTDAYVSRTKVNLRMQIFAEDLYLFQDVEPDQFDRISPADLTRAMEQHKDFLLERVIIRDAQGERLTGRIVSLEPFEIPLEGVEVGRLMEYMMIYQLEYDLQAPPEFLTFEQEIVDDNFVFPSEMKLFLKQSGSETPFQTVLRPNDPYTARFDWDSPPLSPEADAAAWEEWFNQQREETLGITSYGSIYSFVYITPREIRHEILIPLGTLANLFEIERADANFLEIEEQDRIKPQIEELLRPRDVALEDGTTERGGNLMIVDGIEVPPQFDRIDFYGLNLRDFAMQSKRDRVSMASGRVGVIMSYPTKMSPSDVKLTWDLWGPNIVSVESVVFAFDETLKAKFSRFKTRDENTYNWADAERPELPSLNQVSSNLPERPTRKIPVITCGILLSIPMLWLMFGWSRARLTPLLLISGGLVAVAAVTWPFLQMEIDDPLTSPPELAADDQSSVFSRLHSNTYRAFDYRNESDIYDALATSVDGDLLRELYLNIRSNLEVQDQGGAVAHVEEVSISESEPLSGEASPIEWPGFRYKARWTVRGTVEHWGHIHERTNEYTGEFTVQPSDDAWKITSMQLTDEKQLSKRTNLRKF